MEEPAAHAGQKRHAPESPSPVSVVTPKDEDIQAGGSAASNTGEDKARCRPILKRSRACIQCRQAKVKCDGEMPCSRCVQRRKGDACRLQDGGGVSKGDANLGIGLAQRHQGAARASTCTGPGLAGLGQPWAGSDLFAGQPMGANVLLRASHSPGDGWPQGLTAPSVSAVNGLSTGSMQTGSEWGTGGKGVGLEGMGGGMGGLFGAQSAGSVAGIGLAPSLSAVNGLSTGSMRTGSEWGTGGKGVGLEGMGIGIGGLLGAQSAGSVAGIGPGSLNAAPSVLSDLIRQCIASSRSLLSAWGFSSHA